MKNPIKKGMAKKILKKILKAILVLLIVFVCLILLIVFSSNVRESIVGVLIEKIDQHLIDKSLVVEDLQSPNISTYQFSKLHYADIEIESALVEISLTKLLSKVLVIKRLEVEKIPLDFLLSSAGDNKEPIKLDYSEYLNIKAPVDIIINSVVINEVSIDQLTTQVAGTVSWLTHNVVPELSVTINEGDNYLNLKIESTSKNNFQLDVETQWDDLYGYQNIKQSFNSNIQITDELLLQINVLQSKVELIINELEVKSNIQGDVIIDLNLSNTQVVKLDGQINDSVVSLDAQINKKTMNVKANVDALDVSIIQTLLPNNELAKNSKGELSGEILMSGRFDEPVIDATVLIDGKIYGEIFLSQVNIKNQNKKLILVGNVESGFLDTVLTAQIDLKNKKSNIKFDVTDANEKIKKLKFFELDKPFDDTQVKLNGVIEADVDFLDDININWKANLEAIVKEESDYLEAELEVEGDLSALTFSKLIIKNANNNLIASGEIEFENIDMALDVQFELENLGEVLWVNEILSDQDIQNNWFIKEYVEIYKQDVYEYQRLFESLFNGELTFIKQDEALLLKPFSINVHDKEYLKFDFKSDSIDLNLITAENSVAYLNWKESNFTLNGELAFDGNNDFNVKFKAVESSVINPIIKFYEFNDYAIFDWQATGEVQFNQKFENINWDLDADVHLIKEERFVDLDILAKGDLEKIKIESLFVVNKENNATVYGDYDIDNFIIDVNADVNVSLLFTIPWVSEVWADEVLQEKWLLNETIADYKLNVPQSALILQSNAIGQLDILYSDDVFQLENMDFNITSLIFNQTVNSEIHAKLMDINSYDFLGMDFKLNTNDQNITVFGDFSYAIENDLNIKFNDVESNLVFDVLSFYDVLNDDDLSAYELSFITKGEFDLKGLYEKPDIELGVFSSVFYDDVEFSVDVSLELSGFLIEPNANLALKLESKNEKYPVNLLLESSYAENVITVSQIKADLLESGYVSFDGRYENDFINNDVLAGNVSFNYDYQFDIEKLNDFLVNRLELAPQYFSIEGDVLSNGTVAGKLSELNWLSHFDINATVLTQVGEDPVNVQLNHDITSVDDVIGHSLMFKLDDSLRLDLSGGHENDIESLMLDPLNVDWNIKTQFTGQLNPLVKIIPEVDERIYGDVLLDLNVSNKNSKLTSNGSSSIKQGRYINEDLGLAVNQFSMQAELNEKIVTLDIKAKDDKRGAINSKGRFELSKEILNSVYMEIDFLKAQLVERPDVDSQLDGKIVVTGDANQLLVSGDIIAKQTSVYLDRMQLVGVPEIVVSKKDAPANVASAFFETINLDVNVSTDDKTKVSGRGVKMSLTGNASIKGNLDEPLIFAELNLLNGQFDLFTRIFEIEKGLVRMENDDVFVELQARHVRDSIEYIALISGVEGKYDIQLSSVPVYDQNQLISQLMFGKSIEKINAFQALRMAQALSYLKNNGSQYNVLKTTEEILDVDNIDIQTIDGVMQLLVGKYLNDKVYLQLGTSRSSNQSNVNGLLQIELNENLELKTYSGTNEGDSGVELQWKNDY